MKVSVSLPDEDVEFLDRCAPRKASGRGRPPARAVRLLHVLPNWAPRTSKRGRTGPTMARVMHGRAQQVTGSADAPR